MHKMLRFHLIPMRGRILCQSPSESRHALFHLIPMRGRIHCNSSESDAVVLFHLIPMRGRIIHFYNNPEIKKLRAQLGLSHLFFQNKSRRIVYNDVA